MAGEPVGGFVILFRIDLGITEIEHLNLDAMGQAALTGGQTGDTGGGGPNKDPGVSAFFFVHPFAEELEIDERLAVADDAGGGAGAEGVAALPAPCVIVAIDVGKVFAGEDFPSGGGAIGRGLGISGGCGHRDRPAS